jgi:hypothetical protein
MVERAMFGLLTWTLPALLPMFSGRTSQEGRDPSPAGAGELSILKSKTRTLTTASFETGIVKMLPTGGRTEDPRSKGAALDDQSATDISLLHALLVSTVAGIRVVTG